MHAKLWLSVVLTGAVFTGCGDDTTNTDEGDGGNVIIDSGAHD
ncbi:MAG: hypothetical protein JWN04_5329, partial [Myxococcaceae bacterium]|nr:hypothetical protein [Myxococcaceae bacterium]